jgi:hypothetical protein
MHLTTDQIETEALSLARADRVRILDALMVSLAVDPEVEQAWDEEIRQRIHDIDAGVTRLIPGDEVLTEIEDTDGDPEAIWDEEAHRRHQAFVAGELASLPAKEALAQLRKQITEQRS